MTQVTKHFCETWWPLTRFNRYRSRSEPNSDKPTALSLYQSFLVKKKKKKQLSCENQMLTMNALLGIE